jgi:MoxR-like ATPase
MRCAKCRALLHARDFVVPEDIRYLLSPVMLHRLQLTPEAELDGFAAERVLEEAQAAVRFARS